MKKILVVDDDPPLYHLLNHLLSSLGHRLDRAVNNQEAAGRLKDDEYDFILLDLEMDHINGKALYLNIEADFPQMTDRVAFLTQGTSNSELELFIKETGRLRLQKPFTIKEVKGLLQKFV